MFERSTPLAGVIVILLIQGIAFGSVSQSGLVAAQATAPAQDRAVITGECIIRLATAFCPQHFQALAISFEQAVEVLGSLSETRYSMALSPKSFRQICPTACARKFWPKLRSIYQLDYRTTNGKASSMRISLVYAISLSSSCLSW